MNTCAPSHRRSSSSSSGHHPGSGIGWGSRFFELVYLSVCTRQRNSEMCITPTRETVVSLFESTASIEIDHPIRAIDGTEPNQSVLPNCLAGMCHFVFGPELKPQPDTLGRLVLHVCTATQLIRGTGVPSHCWDYPNAASSKCPARC